MHLIYCRLQFVKQKVKHGWYFKNFTSPFKGKFDFYVLLQTSAVSEDSFNRCTQAIPAILWYEKTCTDRPFSTFKHNWAFVLFCFEIVRKKKNPLPTSY